MTTKRNCNVSQIIYKRLSEKNKNKFISLKILWNLHFLKYNFGKLFSQVPPKTQRVVYNVITIQYGPLLICNYTKFHETWIFSGQFINCSYYQPSVYFHFKIKKEKLEALPTYVIRETTKEKKMTTVPWVILLCYLYNISHSLIASDRPKYNIKIR